MTMAANLANGSNAPGGSVTSIIPATGSQTLAASTVRMLRPCRLRRPRPTRSARKARLTHLARAASSTYTAGGCADSSCPQ